MSQQIIYHRKQYNIIKIDNVSFIVYNTDKKFKDGHTHVNSLFIAKAIIHYCISGDMNKKYKHLLKNNYVQESINRVI